MDKKLIQEALRGSDNPKELLKQIAINALQDKASISYTTKEAPPPTIEAYWQASPYAGKKYAVRFVARVVTQWIDRYAKSYSISPDERNILDNRIYALLEKE